jgi:hypothetical protein
MSHVQSATRGRPFEKGNSGRPANSKNRKTHLTSEQGRRLLDRAYEVAMEGEPQLLRFLLTRILPKDRFIHLDMDPIGADAREAADSIAAIMRAVFRGEITPQEGTDLATLATQYSRALDIAEIISRMDLIEAKIK